MPRPTFAQVTSLLSLAVPVLERAMWPVFLWLLLCRKDTHEHIRTVLRLLERATTLKILGVEIVLVAPETVQATPAHEIERPWQGIGASVGAVRLP